MSFFVKRDPRGRPYTQMQRKRDPPSRKLRSKDFIKIINSFLPPRSLLPEPYSYITRYSKSRQSSRRKVGPFTIRKCLGRDFRKLQQKDNMV